MSLEQLINDRYPKMSRERKKIASYILANKHEILYITSEELAARIGVNGSTVVRFAQFLGFKKYKDMQKLAREGNEDTYGIIDQFNKDHNELAREKPYLRAVENDLKNIQETINNLDEDALNIAVEKLLNARRIGITASRGGLAPAIVLQTFLTEFFDNAILLHPGTGTYFDVIKNWNALDVIVCFEYRPTKGHTYSVIEYAKKHGCYIISVIPEFAFTIKEFSDLVFEIKKHGTLISYTSSIVLVNVLVDLLSQKANEKIAMQLEETSKILKHMDKG